MKNFNIHLRFVSSYLNKWPNNYTFSKCLSEDLIKESIMEIPTAVVRPSISNFYPHCRLRMSNCVSVTNTIKGPIPGWINNYHGFIAITSGGYVGVLQNFYGKKEKKLHLVPSDFVCNCILAAAWVTTNSKTFIVFNCVGKHITLGG